MSSEPTSCRCGSLPSTLWTRPSCTPSEARRRDSWLEQRRAPARRGPDALLLEHLLQLGHRWIDNNAVLDDDERKAAAAVGDREDEVFCVRVAIDVEIFVGHTRPHQ